MAESSFTTNVIEAAELDSINTVVLSYLSEATEPVRKTYVQSKTGPGDQWYTGVLDKTISHGTLISEVTEQ